ncbi:sulfur transport [Mogibacterium sp. CM50]|jgi:yeeE/yedE family protein (DUF395)|uniref:Sulfur transport n=1 Tax=Mogibacterium timidum ATCC 33093 TaxID=1401079 RepID=X8IS83_9FIRM|nr:sulfur transport [Mogibacterium sp. CM50]EUC52660.1 sulfur transport [Mogibacterium timidum ATCC 33093]
MLVLGIVVGSLLTSLEDREFHVILPGKRQIIKTVIGSSMMAFGALVAGGCIVGNGLVKTAQFSIKAWIALIFIAMGIWLAAYIFYADRSGKKM